LVNSGALHSCTMLFVGITIAVVEPEYPVAQVLCNARG
jgi:hypothetical protein